MEEDLQLICWYCRRKLIELCGIPSGSVAAELRGLDTPRNDCFYCGLRQSRDDMELAQWVPLSKILRYEAAMAVQEMLKKKLKNATALEVVQSRLLTHTTVRQVFGPTVDEFTRQIVRRPCNVLKIVSARTRNGVELLSGQGVIGELFWPEARYVRLTLNGFEFIDSKEDLLVAYEWQEDGLQAAQ